MKVTVRKYGINGEGIAYYKRKPLFIPGVMVDEEVEVRINKTYPDYYVGEALKINNFNPRRLKVRCPHYQMCGGCQLRHVAYAEQLKIKKAILDETLMKYASLQADYEVVPSPSVEHYRNALKLPLKTIKGQLQAGLYSEKSHRFIAIKDCLNQENALNACLKKVLEVLNKYHLSAYDRRTRKGMRMLVMREIQDRISLCLITGDDRISKNLCEDLLKIKGLTSLYRSINHQRRSDIIFGERMEHLGGEKTLNFTFNDYHIAVSPQAFLQLNTQASARLYQYVASLCDAKEDLLVEGYAGIGLMSFLLHERFERVVALDNIQAAVKDGRQNARNNDISNITFKCADCAKGLKAFKKGEINTLIVDPPRSGMHMQMLKVIEEKAIPKIIYISCNPATLAKNLAVLNKDYRLKEFKAFDLFPMTALIESVAVLQRRK